MEERDLKLIEKFAPLNPELKDLWENHILFTKQLEKLEAQAYRTPEEEQKMKTLKVQKLEGKTKLMDLLERLAKENA